MMERTEWHWKRKQERDYHVPTYTLLGPARVLCRYWESEVSASGEHPREADLIAAAPDMLESLKECHDLLVAAHMGTLIIGRARKAIAKAEGRG